jgi:hypothetical protein
LGKKVLAATKNIYAASVTPSDALGDQVTVLPINQNEFLFDQ